MSKGPKHNDFHSKNKPLELVKNSTLRNIATRITRFHGIKYTEIK